MTFITWLASLMGAAFPVFVWLVAMGCDTAILITAMLTGVIHR